MLSRLFGKVRLKGTAVRENHASNRYRPQLEPLEDRLVPSAVKAAIWLDGFTQPDGGGSGILTSMTHHFGAGSFQLVTTDDLNTPGFLKNSGFNVVIVSRFDSNGGTFLPAMAAANIQAYVGAAGSSGQGGVAVLTNDASDNLFGATTGDPFDANLDQLFANSVQFAANTGHGYVGEYNGAVMAMTANTTGAAPIGLLTGSAGPLLRVTPPFVYQVGPIGAGHAIDNGIAFPFTDTDLSTFRTDITGALAGNIVDFYSSPSPQVPAVLANAAVINGLAVGQNFGQGGLVSITNWHYDAASNTIKGTVPIINLGKTDFKGTFSLIFSSGSPFNEDFQLLLQQNLVFPFTPNSSIQPDPLGGTPSVGHGFTQDGHAFLTFNLGTIPAHGFKKVNLVFFAGKFGANALGAFWSGFIPGFHPILSGGFVIKVVEGTP